MLSAPYDPDVKNGRGYTALCQSSTRGHTHVVRLLLEAHADPDVPSKQGVRPLMMASGLGHLETVRVLCKAGASMELIEDASGNTALMLAAYNGRLDVLRFLVEAGAQLHVRCLVPDGFALSLSTGRRELKSISPKGNSTSKDRWVVRLV